MTVDELDAAERRYGVLFPEEMREVYMRALPVSSGFYPWNSENGADIQRIETALRRPVRDILENPGSVYWYKGWGVEPQSSEERDQAVSEKVLAAPALLPVCGHRYTLSVRSTCVPVYSVAAGDVIYYGENFLSYIEVELGGRPQSCIDFSSIPHESFWDDLVWS